jgi:hypothetical protein
VVNENGVLIDVNDRAFEIAAITATNDIVNDFFNIELYPNPVTSMAWLKLSVKSVKPITLVLYDNMGIEKSRKLLGISNGRTISTTLSLGHLPKGMYYIKLVNDKNMPVLKLLKL